MGPKKGPAAAAPITSTSLEVMEEGRRKRIDLQRKQGFNSTLYAGNPDTSTNTKLGGGV